MTSSYAKLFTVELLHEYFLNRQCIDLDIVPAGDCLEISKRMNIQWRNTENQLIAFIRENEVQEPFINTPPAKFYRKYYNGTVFRFYLKLRNPAFFNYTNINFSYTAKKKFYFSNLAKNEENGLLYLTAPVEEYAAGKDYLPGNIVRDPASGNLYEAIKKNSSTKKTKLTDGSTWAPKGLLHLSKSIEDYATGKTYSPGGLVKEPGTDNVFEAIKKYSGTNVKDLKDPSLWVPRGQGQLQYPTDNDLIDYGNNNYIFQVSAPINQADISVFGFNFNAAKPDYDLPILEKETRKFPNPVTHVNINLSGLTPGRYEVHVNDDIKTIYYDPFLNAGNLIGVIDIFNHISGKDDYSLLDNDEKIRNVKYNIQFPNRRVLWKYIRKDGKAKSITDTGDTGYLFKLNGEEFVSAGPIPLSESVLKTLKLDFNSKDFSMHPLPNPTVQRLGKFTQDDYDYLCSEIFLNY